MFKAELPCHNAVLAANLPLDLTKRQTYCYRNNDGHVFTTYDKVSVPAEPPPSTQKPPVDLSKCRSAVEH